MNDSLKQKNDVGPYHLIILLIVGFILRFTISFIHSYSSDELSAIYRLKFDGFHAIIENAVMYGDMHPAGVQLFEEFWSSLFGTSELALRFPFVIMGVASIWMTFLIGKNFLSKKAGIIAATFLTITYFPIIHSELARPYSPGLLFSLCVAWFWLRVLFPSPSDNSEKHPEKKPVNKWIQSLGLGVSFALAMYTHYFAFMFVGFIGITGLFFVKKKTILPYVSAGALGILLHLPHLSVTLHHLTQDGGIQWLGLPDNTWIIQFVFHAFNESWVLLITTIALMFVALKTTKIGAKPTSNRKYILIFAIWFVGIYLIAHAFSILSSPILKFPIMLFPLPFLWLIIGSFFQNIPSKTFNILFAVLLFIGGISTIFEKNLYGNKHFGVFKELVEPMVKWRKQYGSENISTYMNVSNPAYLNYYAKQMGDSLTFNKSVMEFSEDVPIREELLTVKTDYCIVGYSARLTLPQIFQTCLEFYPVIIDHVKLNNCAVFLLAKKGKATLQPRKKDISAFVATNPNSNWTYTPGQIINGIYHSDSTNIYGPNYVFKKQDIKVDYPYNLLIEVEGIVSDESDIVVNLTAKRNGEDVKELSGETIWKGKTLQTMLLHPSPANKAYFVLEIPNRIRDTDDIQISLWNVNGKLSKVKSMRIYALENCWN